MIEKPSGISRRWFLRRLRDLAVLGGGALGWTTFVEPHWLSFSTYPLTIPSLPAHWKGKRLVQISDFHIGSVDIDYLRKCMHRVNEVAPDLLVVTGDFIDHNASNTKVEVDKVLRELKPGSIGTVACLGNHDFGRSWSQLDVAERLTDQIHRSGIHLLRDERIQIEGLDIFGLEDFWTPRFDAKSILVQADSERPSLCLCHNPDVCDRPVWGNFRGVILSGHTHGGQCKPPFLPAPVVPVVNKSYTQGFYDFDDGRRLFINRGLGYTKRLRFNCRPEVTVFELS
jgi:predicted MPP superfamily phosphohydrolase